MLYSRSLRTNRRSLKSGFILFSIFFLCTSDCLLLLPVIDDHWRVALFFIFFFFLRTSDCLLLLPVGGSEHIKNRINVVEFGLGVWDTHMLCQMIQFRIEVRMKQKTAWWELADIILELFGRHRWGQLPQMQEIEEEDSSVIFYSLTFFFNSQRFDLTATGSITYVP